MRPVCMQANSNLGGNVWVSVVEFPRCGHLARSHITYRQEETLCHVHELWQAALHQMNLEVGNPPRTRASGSLLAFQVSPLIPGEPRWSLCVLSLYVVIPGVGITLIVLESKSRSFFVGH